MTTRTLDCLNCNAPFTSTSEWIEPDYRFSSEREVERFPMLCKACAEWLNLFGDKALPRSACCDAELRGHNDGTFECMGCTALYDAAEVAPS